MTLPLACALQDAMDAVAQANSRGALERVRTSEALLKGEPAGVALLSGRARDDLDRRTQRWDANAGCRVHWSAQVPDQLRCRGPL